jgi:hypothetical protein
MPTQVKNLEPGEMSWIFLDGSTRSAVVLGQLIIGRGTYLPGWRWSEHVGKQTGKTSESHTGYIVSGYMMALDADGKESKVGPGDAFQIAAGHDGWVVGDEPCVALDFEIVR